MQEVSGFGVERDGQTGSEDLFPQHEGNQAAGASQKNEQHGALPVLLSRKKEEESREKKGIDAIVRPDLNGKNGPAGKKDQAQAARTIHIENREKNEKSIGSEGKRGIHPGEGVVSAHRCKEAEREEQKMPSIAVFLSSLERARPDDNRSSQ